MDGFFSSDELHDCHACPKPESNGQGSGKDFAGVGDQRDRRGAERLSLDDETFIRSKIMLNIATAAPSGRTPQISTTGEIA